MLRKLFLISFLIATVSFAQVVTTTKVQKAKGTGVGSTRTEAVNEAIVEAVGQITGVKIRKKTIVENLEVEDDQGGKLSLKYNAKINKYTSGKADSYKILSVHKRNDSLYQAEVLVTNKKVTKEYRVPGYKKNRRAVAIIPSYTSQGNYSILRSAKSSKNVSQRLTQELISSITQTRKFTVLDREANEAYRSEKAVIASRDAGKDELLKLGQVLGADYLLVTNLTELNISKDNSGSAIAANMSSSYKAFATVQYRIIAMASRQIKWSNTTTYEFEPSGASDEQIYLDSLKKISQKITTELIENIYPIKIVNAQNGQITINQGSLAKGTQYEVYKLGKKLYDSYTKESLGRTEALVGKIEVIRSLPKYSVAKIIEGKAYKGNICRTIASNSGKSSDYFDTPKEEDFGGIAKREGGGVDLPFD